MAKRIFLDVTSAVAEYAKQHGAKYDSVSKRWFVFEPVPPQLQSHLRDKPKQVPDYALAPFCLKCGSQMCLKTNSQTGEGFWGCSNFPGCRGRMSWDPSNQSSVGDASRQVADSLGRPFPPRKASDDSLKLRRIRIEQRALEVLGDGVLARRWLTLSKVALGGKSPADVMKNERGYSRVEALLSEFEEDLRKNREKCGQ